MVDVLTLKKELSTMSRKDRLDMVAGSIYCLYDKHLRYRKSTFRKQVIGLVGLAQAVGLSKKQYLNLAYYNLDVTPEVAQQNHLRIGLDFDSLWHPMNQLVASAELLRQG